MRRLISLAITFFLAAVIAHFGTLYAVPGTIMGAAMDRVSESGAAYHKFALAPRTTPQSQTVVRPSPDLSYSVCLFDLAGDDALHVRVGAYGDYTSVSFFDDRTNNFSTVRVGAGGRPTSVADVVLLAPGKAPLGENIYPGLQIEAPSGRGLILVRRLARTEAQYAEVEDLAAADSCAKFTR